MRNAVHRDLELLHDLQKRGLGFGGRAVDFVGQHDLAHDRAGVKFHVSRFEIDHRKARHVAGNDVGRELNAVKAAIQRFGKAGNHRGFAGAGNVLDQHVAFAQHGDQRQLNRFFLADDHTPDILFQSIDNLPWIEH